MKIAHFSDTFLPEVNGVAFSVDGFSREQIKRHQVNLYVPAYIRGKMLERRGKIEIRRYASVPLPTYKNAHLTVPDILEIYKSLIEFEPDLIHFHTPATIGLTGILMAKIMHVPLVGTYHTLFSEVLDYVSVRKWLDKYLKAIEKAANGVGLDLGLLKNGEEPKAEETSAQKLTWSVINRVYKFADFIVVPSAAIERELVKRKVSRAKLGVISNGLDIRRFTAKNNYRLTNKLLHVGRLGFEKNVGVVIKAFAQISGQLPRLTLVIAGDGPAKKELEKLASDLAIKGRVKFLGMVRRDKLPWIYRDADVFLTASGMETQGLVVLEAMACGVPVVAVEKYALCDMVTEGVTGFKADLGDAAGMAEKTLRLLADEKLRQELGINAREAAEGQSLEKMALKLEGVYTRLTS